MAICPKCERDIPEAEFCPFDGTPIGAPTIVAEPMIGDYDYLIGTQLDSRYTIHSKIGEGGMGVVFLARHSVIEKPFAVKILKRSPNDSGQMARRFVQEAKAASRIRHPNVVDVTDFGATPDGVSYQVMEFIDGETLASVLRSEGVLAVPRALTIAAQIARALSAAHKMGVVHRDLKPDNVFLMQRPGRGETVKIVDFGIAKVQPRADATFAPRLTQVGTIFGTPEYMAPEQASGRVDVDHRADIYSLGCVTFEMLTGRVPIQGSNTVKTVAMQILDTIPTMASVNRYVRVNPKLEAAVRKSLAKSPQDRFDDMDQFLQALADASTANELDLSQILSREMEAVQANQPGNPVPPVDPSFDVVANSDKLSTANWSEPPEAKAFAETPKWAMVGPSQNTVFFDEIVDPNRVTGQRPTWLWLIGGSLAIAALLIGLAFAFRGNDSNLRRAWKPTRTETAVATSTTDAGVADAHHAPSAADAAVKPAPSANTTAKRTRSSRPKKEPILGPPSEVRIFTRPVGAKLYAKNSYLGSDQLTLVRPLGTAMIVECSLPGYKSGHISVRFDGQKTTYTCVLVRKKICLDDLRNPYDECKDDPL